MSLAARNTTTQIILGTCHQSWRTYISCGIISGTNSSTKRSIFMKIVKNQVIIQASFLISSIIVLFIRFSNSELGQTLWKSSGLAKIMKQMTDKNGRIQYEKILESFDNPMLRRRWIKSATNFVADWISHISDPVTQQRYMQTAQFVGNSFLKSQGYPKSVMFEPSRPAESLSRLVNAVAMRHLNMKIDSYKYIKPAVAYIQELMSLASEKGFIVSRINARELSNRLSDTMNNDIMNPILRVSFLIYPSFCLFQLKYTVIKL